jgi:tRNA (cytidine32/uridine32-2'-O)-methyltransferase
MFERMRIILVNTTHPGNIGAVARAIKNMGFKQLYLVSPQQFPSMEATARASGAEDVLASAVVTKSLEEALYDCALVMGLSGRARKIAWPTLEAREAADKVATELNQQNQSSVALVFGQEQSGLLNEALAKCHYQVTISANPDYSSLNLAQAVQVLTYECRMALLKKSAIFSNSDQMVVKNKEPEQETIKDLNAEKQPLVTAEEIEYYFTHLENTLKRLQFLDPARPRHLMKRLRRLYNKARLDKTELNILQGILTAINKRL